MTDLESVREYLRHRLQEASEWVEKPFHDETHLITLQLMGLTRAEDCICQAVPVRFIEHPKEKGPLFHLRGVRWPEGTIDPPERYLCAAITTDGKANPTMGASIHTVDGKRIKEGILPYEYVKTVEDAWPSADIRTFCTRLLQLTFSGGYEVTGKIIKIYEVER